MRKEKKSCEELSRLYAAGEMSSAQASDFEAHLSGCETCKKQVREWEELFSALSSPLYDVERLEPRADFDKPVMAFVRNLIGERERAAARVAEITKRAPAWDQAAASRAPVPIDASVEAGIRRRAIWVGIAAIAAVLVIFSNMLSRFAPGSPEYGRPYVVAITWALDAFHKGFEWLVFNFLRSIKIGEVVVLVFEKMRPIWNSLGVAARQLDPQLVLVEVLLLMLSLVLLRGFLGAAPKGRCTNVGIII